MSKTAPLPRLRELEKAGVTLTSVPRSDESIDKAKKTVTFTFKVTGGNGNVSAHSGTVDLSGSLVFTTKQGQVALSSLKLNLKTGTFEGKPNGSSTLLPLEKAHGITTRASSTSQSYDASRLTITPAAAAYVNKALDTSVFAAGAGDGSLAATWTFSA